MKLLLATIGLLLAVVPANSQEAADAKRVAEGKALAQQNCVTCHAIGPEGPSTLRDAPPFRDIAANYGPGELEDAFNEGVATEHPVMPDWEMTPEQASALAAYIMSLAPHGMKKTELSP